MVEWAKDKRPVWEAVVNKYGGKPEAFDWGTWGFFNWATGKSWCTISSITKARKYGGTALITPLRRGLRRSGLMRMRGFFLLVVLFWRIGIRKIQADSSL